MTLGARSQMVPHGAGRDATGRGKSSGVIARRIKLVQVMTAPQSLFYLIRGQVEYMRERGIDTVGIASPGPLLHAFAERDKVPVVAIDMSREISPVRDLVSLARLWQSIRRERPDIVQSGTPKGGLLGMIAAWLARVPVRIYTIRGLPVETAQGVNRRILWLTEWLSCRLAHRVVCVSPLLRELVIAEGICRAEKIVTFRGGSGNGVDATVRFNPDTVDPAVRAEIRRRYGIPDEGVVLGFVGRLNQLKGVVELTAAWQELRERYPRLYLLAIGGFDDHDPVPEGTRAQLTTDDRVILAGPIDDTPPLYAAMDVFVLPTYREGVPNVVLEASAMRLPIVSTLVPGPLDVILDDQTGILVPPQDAGALSAAIARYLDNPALRIRHAEAARQRVVREFRQEDIWAAWHQEYRWLLGARGVRTADGNSPSESLIAEPTHGG